jgi:hypothetical protein
MTTKLRIRDHAAASAADAGKEQLKRHNACPDLPICVKSTVALESWTRQWSFDCRVAFYWVQ